MDEIKFICDNQPNDTEFKTFRAIMCKEGKVDDGCKFYAMAKMDAKNSDVSKNIYTSLEHYYDYAGQRIEAQTQKGYLGYASTAATALVLGAIMLN